MIRRVIGEAVLGAEGQRAHRPVDEGQGGPVTDGHAFRLAGGAGRVEDIRQVVPGRRRGRGRVMRRHRVKTRPWEHPVDRAVVRRNVVREKDGQRGHRTRGEPEERPEDSRRRDQVPHGAVAKDERDAGRGRRQVHGHVGGARLQDPVERGERGRRLRQTERHPVAALDAGAAQPAGDPIALLGERAVREGRAVDDERRRLGATRRRSIEQLGEAPDGRSTAPCHQEAQEPGDQHGLELRRAGIEPPSDGIAELPFDLELRRVAVAPVGLEGVQGRVDRRLADEELRDRGFQRRRLPLGLRPRRPIEEQAGRIEPDPHPGDLLGDELELPDRLAELTALADVLDARLEPARHRADLARQDERPLPVHRAVKDHRAPALPPEPLILGDLALVETDLGDRRRAEPQGVHRRADREPRGAAVHEEGRDALRAERGVQGGEHEEHPRDGRVRAEALRAAEDVAVPPAVRPRRQRQGIGPRVGLRHRMGADDGAAREPGQVARLLRRRAEEQDGHLHGPHVRVTREEQSGVPAAEPHGLHGDGDADRVGRAAAVLGRQGEPEQAERGAPLPGRVGEARRSIAGREVVVEAPGEPDHRGPLRLLLGGQAEVHRTPLSGLRDRGRAVIQSRVASMAAAVHSIDVKS